MTEKLKVKVTICNDGTSNNKTNDTPTGNETNVARIHELQQVDLKFDFSKNGSKAVADLDAVNEGAEGNLDVFNDYLKQIKERTVEDPAISYSLYNDGVGSQKNQDSSEATLEQATGSGTGGRVKVMVDAIEAIRKTYGPDAEIEVLFVDFSRGDLASKAVRNEIADRFHDDPNFSLGGGVSFDPVFSHGYALDNTHTGLNTGFPDKVADGRVFYELLAGNEARSDTFSNIAS